VFDRASWGRWRALFEALLEYEGEAWADDVLLPWVEANPPVVAELHLIGTADSRLHVVQSDRDYYTPLEALYALSRILDVLIAPYQTPVGDPALLNWTTGQPWWAGRLPPVGAYQQFCAALRCQPIEDAEFHPFLHEIVEVVAADDPDEPPSLVAERWPGYFVGSMLLTRVGVTVRAGARQLVKDLATRSPMYWAWWRRNRRALDLSHGWGHNSQWGTEFRRDYWVDGHLYYNVDAERRPGVGQPEVGPAVARDLLRYRHNTTVDADEQWIWNSYLVEPAPTSRRR
jgi:hypothetical protein